jgi:hypothetical protein
MLRARLVPCICPSMAPGMQFFSVWMLRWGHGPGPRRARCSPEPGCKETKMDYVSWPPGSCGTRASAGWPKKLGLQMQAGDAGAQGKLGLLPPLLRHARYILTAAPLPILSLALTRWLSALSSLASSCTTIEKVCSNGLIFYRGGWGWRRPYSGCTQDPRDQPPLQMAQ